MQAQGDVGIFGGIGAGFFQIDLVEGQLFGTLAGNGFVGDGLLAQVFPGQAVHVVAGGHRVIDIGLQHGVLGDPLQIDAVIGEHVLVVLEVLPHLFLLRIFQQRFELLQYLVAVELVRRTHVVVGQGHVSRFARFHRERHPDNFGVDVPQAGGLRVKGEQVRGLQAPDPIVQFVLLGDDAVLLFL